MATLFDGIGANGFSSGFAAGNAVREMKEKQARQKGLASGFTKVLNGDNTGWQEMANADPVATMNAWNTQQALKQKDAITPYQQAMIDLKRQEIAAQTEAGKNLSPYDRTRQMEQAKNDIEIERGDQDFQKMLPSVTGALDRAEKALKSGNGLGRVGATLEWAGLNPAPNSSANYADIEAANTQMNQLLRAKLKATGLTGSELNSAVEANAYRYTISPFANEKESLRKIENFKKDILGIGKYKIEQVD